MYTTIMLRSCFFLDEGVSISYVLGQAATTRATSQMETAVDNSTAVEAEVEGGAAGLQGLPLSLFLDGSDLMVTICDHNWRIGGDIYIDSLSLFVGFPAGH